MAQTLIPKAQLDTTLVDTTSTQNVSGKQFTGCRINPRQSFSASPTTITPAGDSIDIVGATALANALTIANPSGTPNQGQKLLIRLKDNGTARALTWGTAYRAGTDVALPSTTVASKTMYIGFIWNATDSLWDLVALVGNI